MTTRLLSFSLLLTAACNDKSDPVDPVDTGEVDPGPVDSDGDGFSAEDDCDDTDASISPDADELCDGVDNNCDGEIDEDTAVDAATWYADADTDGYGDASAPTTTCSVPSGYVDNTDDCDDTNADIHPDADEYCDGIDNNCNDEIDEDTAVDAATWYADADTDGYGNANAPTTTCSMPSGYVDNTDDCDDTEPAAYTGATEICDGIDNDCNGLTDDESAADASIWYADADGDGFGSDLSELIACTTAATTATCTGEALRDGRPPTATHSAQSMSLQPRWWSVQTRARAAGSPSRAGPTLMRPLAHQSGDLRRLWANLTS